MNLNTRYAEQPSVNDVLAQKSVNDVLALNSYGLEEFSILEHIVKNSRLHYVLLPCYLHDTNLFRIKNEYFKTLNIKAVPYYLDFDGYHRLYDVLKSWTEQIAGSLKSGYYGEIKKIDEVL